MTSSFALKVKNFRLLSLYLQHTEKSNIQVEEMFDIRRYIYMASSGMNIWLLIPLIGILCVILPIKTIYTWLFWFIFLTAGMFYVYREYKVYIPLITIFVFICSILYFSLPFYTCRRHFCKKILDLTVVELVHLYNRC